MQGVGEGSQPLISFQYGANNQEAVARLRKWTYTLAILISIVAGAGIVLVRALIPKFFDLSKEAACIFQVALPLCALSLPFYAFSRVTTEYFNATQKKAVMLLLWYMEKL